MSLPFPVDPGILDLDLPFFGGGGGGYGFEPQAGVQDGDVFAPLASTQGVGGSSSFGWPYRRRERALAALPGSRPGSRPALQPQGGGAQTQGDGIESWEDFLRRYLTGNDEERLLGMYGFDSFNPDAPALSESRERVIRDRGEGRKLGSMLQARLDSGGDPALMSYLTHRANFGAGEDLSGAMNQADLARRESIENFFRELMMTRVLGAQSVDQQRRALGSRRGEGIGFELPNGMGFNFGF